MGGPDSLGRCPRLSHFALLGLPKPRASLPNQNRRAPHEVRGHAPNIGISHHGEFPATHPLRAQLGFESVAERVLVPRKSRDLDTLDNGFVKFALGGFLAFLTHAQGVFESCAGWGASARCRDEWQSGVAAQGWLSRGAALVVAVSHGVGAFVGRRRGVVSRGAARRGEPLRVLAVLRVAGLVLPEAPGWRSTSVGGVD